MKRKLNKISAMLLSFVLSLVMLSQPVMALVVTKTDSAVNTFKPEDRISTYLTISKAVEHPFGEEYKVPEDLAFDFEIDLGAFYAGSTITTSNGNITADKDGKITVSVPADSAVKLENIDNGTNVKITELQNKNGFAVKGGNATQNVTAADGAKAEFINVYTPQAVKADNITVIGTKHLEGRDWRENDSFEFVLEQQVGDGEWKLLGEKTVSYSNTQDNFNIFDFSNEINKLEFDKLGKYTFRVRELQGNATGIVYDKTENYFDITVTDADMDGYLEISDINAKNNITVDKDKNGFSIDVAFKNRYEKPEEEQKTTYCIKVNNTFMKEDGTPLSPEGFTIQLKNVTTGEIVYWITDEDGSNRFCFTYTEEDIGKTDTYILNVVDTGKEGVIYSDKVYEVKLTVVSDEETGELGVKALVNGVPTEEVAIEFLNIYVERGVDDTLTKDKSNLPMWYLSALLSFIMTIWFSIKRKQRIEL